MYPLYRFISHKNGARKPPPTERWLRPKITNVRQFRQ
jgi:hypothetical protein